MSLYRMSYAIKIIIHPHAFNEKGSNKDNRHMNQFPHFKRQKRIVPTQKKYSNNQKQYTKIC